MGLLAVIGYCLLMLPWSTISEARPVHPAPRPLTKQETRFLDNLYNRCEEDGMGQSCNAYGQALLELDPRGNVKVGNKYIRRACAMAYRPACGKKTEGKEEKDAKSDSPKDCASTAMASLTTEPVSLPDGSQGQLVKAIAKDSVLNQAGLTVGDVILRVNTDISEAQRGPAGRGNTVSGVLEIHRKGFPMALPISCK